MFGNRKWIPRQAFAYSPYAIQIIDATLTEAQLQLFQFFSCHCCSGSTQQACEDDTRSDLKWYNIT